ncbi:MAG: PKD domain-containing protein [Bacteroidota bacterium]|nr:PKD domain-containing protein [Bacteroidota bacterium]
MKFKYIYIILIIIQTNIFAQSYKYWSSSDNLNLFYFNDSNDIKVDYRFNSSYRSIFSNISTPNGDLIFSFVDGYNITDENGKNFKNSMGVLSSHNSVFLQTDFNQWNLISGFFYDSTYDLTFKISKSIDDNRNIIYEFYKNNHNFDNKEILNAPFGVYCTKIERDSLNKPEITEKNRCLDEISKYSKRLLITDVKRINQFEYYILFHEPNIEVKDRVNKYSKFFLFKYSKNNIEFIDSIKICVFDFLENDIKSKLKDKKYINFFINSSFLNKALNKMFLNFEISWSSNSYDTFVYHKSMLISYDLKNKFSSSYKVDFENEFNNNNLDDKNKIYTFFRTNNSNLRSQNYLSSNDSIFYYLRTKVKYKNFKEEYFIKELVKWEYYKDNFNSSTLVDYVNNDNTTILSNVFLNSFGGLSYSKSNHTDQTLIVYHMNNNNDPIRKSSQSFNIPTIWSIYNSFNFTLYDYIKLRQAPIIFKDCGAYVNIKNNSDESLGIKNYKWFVAKNDKWTEWDTFNTKELPQLFFKNSGKYLFKLQASAPNGYGEWYIDTIKVRIPPKPVANFYAQDSIVCRYKGLPFKNYSSSLQNTAEDYLWSFGDGKTSTDKNPNHIYTNIGNYTVTLHYKNGYCDSTLTKNQYITVVDAPKPGFAINTTQGCAPLNIFITDTVRRHVSAKDYFISDGSGWVNIPNGETQLNHTFKQAGKYRAVQRLTGYTGCVTMSDSVWIHVSQGLTPKDTLDVQLSTIKTNEEIGVTGKSKLFNIVPGNAFIQWQSQAGAVKYQVNKDGSPYAQTEDTFYTDPRLYNQDATYTVQGIDSCGNRSSMGNVSKPVFLKSNLQGNNESVLVQYSPYLDLPIGVNSLQYELEKLTETNGISKWQPIAHHPQPQTHTDQNINTQGHLQACYRIAVKHNSETISYSNVSCSPFEPAIFIPTGFSPNDDGVNDVYEPMYYGIQSYQLTVYNRWGEQVFLGADNQAWTGEKQSEGVYTVQIRYRLNTGVLKTQNTTVTLLR